MPVQPTPESDSSLDFAFRVQKRRRALDAKRRNESSNLPNTPKPDISEPTSMSGSVVASGSIDTDAQQAEERAALSGYLLPDDLFETPPDTARRLLVLSHLTSFFAVECVEEQMQWRLLPDRRRAVLRRLQEQGQLNAALLAPLPRTDEFGQSLRDVLRHGKDISLGGLTSSQLLNLAAVLELMADVNLPVLGQEDTQNLLTEVRQRLAKQQVLGDYRVLLEGGFVGRESELETLRTFVLNRENTTPGRDWGALMLTGFGGAGKSTLLVKFAQELIENNKATVIILDFDRPGINADDLPWLESEMARQVGRQYPEVENALREARQRARETQVELDWNVGSLSSLSSSSSSSLSAPVQHIQTQYEQRVLRSIVFDMLDALRADSNFTQKIAERPFVLVLDTFEEVAQRELTEQVLGWLNAMAGNLKPLRLQVIFSGRLFDNAKKVLGSYFITQEVNVNELEPAVAAKLLEARGVTRQLAKRLSESNFLPRRPLELRLLARLVVDGGERSVEEIEKELRSGGAKARELFASIVYRRVLLRITDPTVRQLAYPGLVLRYLTTELLLEVLAPVLDIQALQADAEQREAEATRVLDALATYEWLAYEGENGEVWHRKELRRSMLEAMIAENLELARRIHRSAEAFFSNPQRVSKFPDHAERDAAEGIYHRLMLVEMPQDGAGLDLNAIRAASSAIGGDVVDLRAPAAALLRFAVEGHVPAAEVAFLPPEHLAQAYSRAGEELVRHREYGKALSLFIARYGDAPALLNAWELTTLFATASWQSLRTAINQSLASDEQQGEVSDFWRAFTYEILLNLESTRADVLQASWLSSMRKALRLAANFDLASLVSVMSLLRKEDINRLRMGLIYIQAHPHSWLLRGPGGAVFTTVASALQFALDGSFLINAEHQGSQVVLDDSTPSPLSFAGERALPVDNRAVFLEMSGGRRPERPVAVPLPSFRLSPSWLEEFALCLESLRESAARLDSERSPSPLLEEADALSRLAREVRDVLTNPTATGRTVSGTLSAVDMLSTANIKVSNFSLSFDWNAPETGTVLPFLIGPDPEFRDPCRFALLEAFSDREGYKQLAQIICEAVEMELADLQPDAFADAVVLDPEHALEIYIEHVDRCWALDTLLLRAHELRPDASKLAQVQATHARWRETLERTLPEAIALLSSEAS